MISGACLEGEKKQLQCRIGTMFLDFDMAHGMTPLRAFCCYVLSFEVVTLPVVESTAQRHKEDLKFIQLVLHQ